MGKWIVGLVLYGIFLAGCTWLLAVRGIESEPEFFATAPLPFNHLIVEKDLWDATLTARSKPPARSQGNPPSPAASETAASANQAVVKDAKDKSPPASKAAKPSPVAVQPPVARTQPDPKKAKLVGKYTSGNVGQRQLLRTWELTSTPSLGPAGSALRVLLPVDVADITSGRINAGTLLCVGRPAPATVVTVICAAGIEAPCSAVMDLPAADAASLSSEVLGGKKRAEPPSPNNTCN